MRSKATPSETSRTRSDPLAGENRRIEILIRLPEEVIIPIAVSFDRFFVIARGAAPKQSGSRRHRANFLHCHGAQGPPRDDGSGIATGSNQLDLVLRARASLTVPVPAKPVPGRCLGSLKQRDRLLQRDPHAPGQRDANRGPRQQHPGPKSEPPPMPCVASASGSGSLAWSAATSSSLI